MSVQNFIPEPQLEHFDDLVDLARQEGAGAQLLVVLINVNRHQQKTTNGQYQTMDDQGTLMPLGVKAFPVTSATSLVSIAGEADELSTSWEFIMTAVLPGRGGAAVPEEETEGHLTRMAQCLTTAENLDQFAIFTREGEPVRLSAIDA